MNIFILDSNQETCAQYHCDKHVSKMILETAQIMSTVMHKKNVEGPYLPTHSKHPCVLWAEQSMSNYTWLGKLGYELNKEYMFRYSKKTPHASKNIIDVCMNFNFPDQGLTPFAQAMPEEYKVDGNAVKAYRKFYKGEKAHFAKWTKRATPIWFK
jgi:hypothetical protein